MKNAVCHVGASLCAYRVTVTKRKWDEEIAVKEGTNRTKDKHEYMSNSLPTFTNSEKFLEDDEVELC